MPLCATFAFDKDFLPKKIEILFHERESHGKVGMVRFLLSVLDFFLTGTGAERG